MSISYVDDISDGRGIFIFVKLLSRWKGSLYKLVWVDLFMYVILYYVLNLSYRFGMNEQHKQIFQDIVNFCEKMKANIPISFLLGFFVAGVIARWYQMYIYIPWMNKIAFSVMSGLNNRRDEFATNTRLTIMRYMNLSWVLMMRQISDQIATRFDPKLTPGTDMKKAQRKRHRHKLQPDDTSPISDPPMEANGSLLRIHSCSDEEAGLSGSCNSIRQTLLCFNDDPKVKNTFGRLITEEEIQAFESIAVKCFAKNRVRYTLEYWIPLQWAVRIIQKGTLHNMVADPKISFAMIEEIGRLRQQMQDLQIYSSIMIPLVYTQVVIIAAYSYFLCQIFSSQFVKGEEPGNRVDFYFPIFSIFSFLFLMGWLKVAMCVMNPFGDDDEDFQTSDILDYNLEVSYRCCEMSEGMYPKGLDPPDTSHLRKIEPPKDETLEEFVNSATLNADSTTAIHGTDNLRNLELKPSCFPKLCNCFVGPPQETQIPRESPHKTFFRYN